MAAVATMVPVKETEELAVPGFGNVGLVKFSKGHANLRSVAKGFHVQHPRHPSFQEAH